MNVYVWGTSSLPRTLAGFPCNAGRKTRSPMCDVLTPGPKKSDARPMVARTLPVACASMSVCATSARVRPLGPGAS